MKSNEFKSQFQEKKPSHKKETLRALSETDLHKLEGVSGGGTQDSWDFLAYGMAGNLWDYIKKNTLT